MTEVLFDHPAVSALGWTILHSLWQATALAALLWFASRQSGNARLRYGLAYGTMLAQLAVSVITFSWLYEPAATGNPVISTTEIFAVLTAPETGGSYWNPEALMGWVVVFWLVGLCIGSVRMGIAFGRVRRMQSLAKAAVPANFRQRVAALAQRLNYRGTLRIGISDQIGGPALVGHLKPMLLFPVAIVNQLSPEQAEAVILHELAHLSRRDHWWNLLQCVVEVLFYYHPVMWWIGARIREEREHCCDDLVIRHGPGRLPYAKALLYFEQQSATPATAVALTNSPGGLLGRVQRFLHQQNIPYQMKSRLFLLPLLTLIALISTAAYHPVDIELAATETPCPTPAPSTLLAPAVSAQPLLAVTPDTLPQGRHEVSSYRNGESTEVTVEDGKIQKLKINGKDIPSSEFEQHTPMVERLLGVDDDSGDIEFSNRFNSIGFERLELDLEDIEKNLEKSGIRIERHFESLGGDFESLGERMGEMGERLGERFQNMFEFDSDGNVLRFEFNGKEGGLFEFDLDSIVQQGGGSRIFRFDNRDGGAWMERDGDVREYELEELLRDREKSAESEEAEIREMETMIEKLERRKAEKQRDLERLRRDEAGRQRDQQGLMLEEASQLQEMSEELRDGMEELSLNIGRETASATRIIGQLRQEGLIKGNGKLKKLVINKGSIKINGKKISPEAYDRFRELYERQNGKPVGEFEMKIDN